MSGTCSQSCSGPFLAPLAVPPQLCALQPARPPRALALCLFLAHLAVCHNTASLWTMATHLHSCCQSGRAGRHGRAGL